MVANSVCNKLSNHPWRPLAVDSCLSGQEFLVREAEVFIAVFKKLAIGPNRESVQFKVHTLFLSILILFFYLFVGVPTTHFV
jgi:hypothetical protein